MTGKQKHKSSKDEVLIKRSNALIEAKYKSSLMEKKLVALAISKLTIRDSKLVAEMTASEIREALHYSGNSLYEHLRSMSEATMQHYLYIEDDRNNDSFDIIAVLDRARYKNGTLIFTFNDEIKKHTLDVEQRYSLTSLPALLSFDSNNTYRLYEILMINYYKVPQHGTYEIDYSLAQLKFELGLVDVNQPEVQRALKAGKTYEYILENVVKKYPYKDYSNFRVRVLEKAKKDLEKSELSEICFDYKPIRAGRGGRCVGVKFFIKRHGTIQVEREKLRQKELVTDENVNRVMEMSEGRITTREAVRLLAKAGNDYDRVYRIYIEAMKRSGITNLVGWMITALDEQWTFSPLPKEKSKNSYQDFEQRSYDFDELEMQLLNADSDQKAYEEEEDGQLSFFDDLKEDDDDGWDVDRSHVIDAAYVDIDEEEETREEQKAQKAENPLDFKISDLDPELQKLILEKMKQ